MIIRCLSCANCILFLLAAPAPAQVPQDPVTTERTLTAVPATGPIVVDGRLDEPAWQNAPPSSGFIQNEPREGEPADLRYRGAHRL